ncbi:wax ester/triacylglycerol synthase domain-containing protein [Streptomyces sp. NPDC101175]|uniref:wax ester/triacylglycerol synthase domain-containing protein n=1 Tax=Streptomyces sp. NPDC101175 TaxID=3366123 RepID=UPI003835E61D
MTVLTSVVAPPVPNPVDLLFHTAGRLASHAEAVPAVGVVLHLTGDTPDLTRLRERVARRLHRLPCLTHVLTTDDGPPRWTPRAPDLAEHVTERRVPPGPGRLDDTVRELLHRPLPTATPAWRLVVLSGHATGGYCLALIAHHEVQDAANLVTVVEILLGRDDDTPATAVAALDGGPVAEPEPWRLLDAAAFIWRNTRPHGLWNDPARPLSGRRHVLWREVPTALLRDTGRAYGATANDVHLAALAHAVGDWAGTHRPDARLDPLPVMLPVNLRTPAETGLPGNRFFLARLDLPGGPMTPARRLARTVPATAPLKAAAYRRALHRMTAQEPLAYGQLIAASAAPDRLTAVCSSFRIGGRLSHEGDPVDRVVPVICCPDGFPLTAALFLYGETSTVSFQLDRSLPGAEEIPGLWRRAVDDMATCAPETVPGGTP